MTEVDFRRAPPPPELASPARTASIDKGILERVLKGPNGGPALRAIADMAGLGSTTIARSGPIDPHRLAYNEGRRSLALELLHLAGVPLLTGHKGDET